MKRNLTLQLSLIGLSVLLAYGAPRIKPGGSEPGTQQAVARAALGESVTVRAAGRGNPLINLTDGRDVIVGFTDALRAQAARLGQAQPLAMSACDFDEDGVPDLVIGYSGGLITLLRGNVDSVYPNSPDAQARKAAGQFTDAPFLSPTRAFQLNESPDFLLTADFDADGHADVIAAAAGGDKILLMPGDGQGGFGDATGIDLPGAVTTLATADVNRRDGLADVIAGVATETGPRALIYSAPKGAFSREPQSISLPASATAIAAGPFDEDLSIDIAIAAANRLLVVRWLPDNEPSEESPTLGDRTLPFNIRSLVTGNFTGDNPNAIALLADSGQIFLLGPGTGKAQAPSITLAPSQRANSAASIAVFSADRKARVPHQRTSGQSARLKAFKSEDWPLTTFSTAVAIADDLTRSSSGLLIRARTSSCGMDDLMVLDRAHNQLHILAGGPSDRSLSPLPVSLDIEGAPMAMLPMRLNEDALDDLVILRSGQLAPSVLRSAPVNTFTVTSTSDSGAGSLREAIHQANIQTGADLINFNITSGTAPFTISPLTSFEDIFSVVTIDATTQPGFAGVPIIELDGELTPVSTNGFYLRGGASTVRGMAINRYEGVGGSVTNGFGILISDSGNCIVEGNYLGTNITGMSSLGNTQGILIDECGFNRVGGTTAAARNVISGNIHVGTLAGFGVELRGYYAQDNTIAGNYIGTNKNGTAAVGNCEGVLSTAPYNTIGGTTAGARNIISGQYNFDLGGSIYGGFGIEFRGYYGGANDVQGNYIGTTVTGLSALGNSSSGVDVNGSPYVTIGGSTAAHRNIISANLYGVLLSDPGSTGNVVDGNYIGLTKDGNAALGNGEVGVIAYAGANANYIGGSAGNVICANGSHGIVLQDAGTVGNTVQNNWIGLDATGTTLRGNGQDGILINGCSSNTVTTNNILGNNRNGVQIYEAATANVVENCVISYNGFPDGYSGVLISTGASSNTVHACYIGTDADGVQDWGNATTGVYISNAPNNTVGGATPLNAPAPAGKGPDSPDASLRNIISANGVQGVLIAGTASSGNTVQGNYIGTNKAGTAALGNVEDGVFVTSAPGNTIVGNLISGNHINGVELAQADGGGNTVKGNLIGTNVTGTASIGNHAQGVFIYQSPNNVIGGTTSEERNLISGNLQNGITIQNASSTGNQVKGNYIGTKADGVSALPNGTRGVWVYSSASNNSIGGTTSGESNVIAFNSSAGVVIGGTPSDPATGNAVRGNSIYSNAGLGIDLADNAVTANDACDGDTGPNKLQNYPVITSASNYSGGTIVRGALYSTANTSFTFEFFANPACSGLGYGEGRILLGTLTISTGNDCSASFVFNSPILVALGQFITVTATDAMGNTSEFSQCAAVTGNCTYVLSSTEQYFEERGGSGTVAVTAPGGCAWAVTSNDSWITLVTASNCSGNDTVGYEVRDNFSGGYRTGTMTIAGQTYTVHQSGACECSLSSYGKSFTSGGGTSSVNVIAPAGCSWSSSSEVPWITVAAPGTGVGNGTISYTVAPNTGPTRVGTIIIAGETFTVKQKRI